MSAVLFAVSVGPASAQGVHLKMLVRRGGLAMSSCIASVTAPPHFSYDPISGADQYTTAIVTLTCRYPELLRTVELSPGHANEFSRYRQMWRNGTDSSEILEYNFYTTNDYTTVWGDGTGGTSVETVNRTVTTYNALLFAKLKYPPGHVSAGEYSDTVTVTFDLG